MFLGFVRIDEKNEKFAFLMFNVKRLSRRKVTGGVTRRVDTVTFGTPHLLQVRGRFSLLRRTTLQTCHRRCPGERRFLGG